MKRLPGFRSDAESVRLDRLEGAVRCLVAGLAGLAGSLERERSEAGA